MTETKITGRQIIVIASLIFGVLFGAGNLIFPVHLGQLAGDHWLGASSGFLISGVLLPLMALLAISITRSNDIYDLARPNGHYYALIFLILVQATLGPLFAMPRTATVPYTIGFAPHISASGNVVGLLIYTGIFFVIVFGLTVTEAKITDLIGKILNPVFLVLLFIIFFLAFISPMGRTQTTPVTAEYSIHAFSSGFLQGYNTMDILGCLAFGVAIISAIKELGIEDTKKISWTTAKSGTIGIMGIAVIYICLIWLGATSLYQFKVADNGGTTLAQIAHYYMGFVGDALLATLTSVTCLTTAMGLAAAFSEDLHRLFPRVSYKKFLLFNCLFSFLVANLGLDKIIAWSAPVLVFLYPLAITLTILGITSPLFKTDPIVYRVTTGLTFIPAVFDLVNNLPVGLQKTSFAQAMISFAHQYFPLFSLGFSWIPFAVAGFIIGIGIRLVRKQQGKLES
ncbi:branched-chain amino acid transport system II carrier protein [Limosilactobacillus vaginalis]|uniref:branched-chain amino acid transport system II carrier protein n=1 Tax=Limosilactobacillus vaginalis TaxID=1633 RepID=UPI0022A9A0B9|nr:branched-chain amino acid transport system II carrier protein [Limosilactobacillus vaginalis]MCZ2466496.1 branched-chain amino acid transport system II carrier protein [Limosilactobacillus vaginalis]